MTEDLTPQQGGSVTQQQGGAVVNHQGQPFANGRSLALAAGINAGSVAIEQERAIAEAQGQLILAKRFPRDVNEAYQELMNACKVPAFAAAAFYNVPRAGGKVSGPSIRLAEEVARCYGNFKYGHKELGRADGKSEVEVYAWDMEKNNFSSRQITVLHVMDTKEGPKKLRDQKDIDDKIANVASKQIRGRILALMPKWMTEAAMAECRKTIAGDNTEPVEARVRKMQTAFAAFGVTVAHLERHLGHALAETTADELVDLLGIYNAVKEGAPASEYFSAEASAESAAAAEGIKAAAGKGATRPAPKAEDKPAAPASAEKPAAEAKPAADAKAAPSKADQKESKPVKEQAAPAPAASPAPAAASNQAAPGGNDNTEDDVF